MSNLPELDHVKAEQTARIVLRDTALYVHAVALLSIAGTSTALTSHVLAAGLCLFSAATMFGIYVSSDYYVSRISTFVSQENAYVLSWEQYRRQGAGYWLQKLVRAIVVLVAFAAIPLYVGAHAISLRSLRSEESLLLGFMALITWEAGIYVYSEFGPRK